MADLPDQCVPCRRGDAPVDPAEAEALLAASGIEWALDSDADVPCLRRAFELDDFRAALRWVNRVGMLAEEEGHHPDFHLTGWNRVELVLWTHAIGGLHINDFVLARKIDRLWEASSS